MDPTKGVYCSIINRSIIIFLCLKTRATSADFISDENISFNSLIKFLNRMGAKLSILSLTTLTVFNYFCWYI